jgi:hypothetical protein
MTLSGAVQAQSNVQFSGLAVQSGPDGKTKESRMYVGDNQVRMEHDRNGQSLIEIYDMKHQRVLLIVPEQKVYMQRDFAPGMAGNPIEPPKDSNPCASMPDAQCKKVATDTLYGRPVSQWEMHVERDGKTLNSLHWMDDKRHMSLRDVWPDGSTTESILQGKETLHGRPTERWQQITKTKDGEEHTTTQWYDPELQIAVREEMPGGYFREIRDIRVGPQAANLFEVPAGYTRVENDKQASPPEDTSKKP